MPDQTTPNESDFTKCVFIGLVWGAAAATGLMCGALLLDAASAVHGADVAFRVIIAIGTLVGASLLAFILFPIAALLAWPLYRHGVRAHAAYMLAGAIATLPLVAIFQMSNGGVFQPTLTSVAWFAISGAFGGFMGARALQREA